MVDIFRRDKTDELISMISEAIGNTHTQGNRRINKGMIEYIPFDLTEMNELREIYYLAIW